jgi:hypothetical protein
MVIMRNFKKYILFLLGFIARIFIKILLNSQELIGAQLRERMYLLQCASWDYTQNISFNRSANLIRKFG